MKEKRLWSQNDLEELLKLIILAMFYDGWDGESINGVMKAITNEYQKGKEL